MLFDTVAFREFLWGEYKYQFFDETLGRDYDDVYPEMDVYSFDNWIEKNLTKMQMVGHLCEFLAERELCVDEGCPNHGRKHVCINN